MKKRRKKQLSVIISVIFLIIVFLGLYYFSFSFILFGDDVINIKLNESYVEPGYKCKSLFKDDSSNVVVSNDIDNTKVGSYKIKYKIKRLFVEISKERVVNIVDDEKPVISLKGDLSINIFKGSKYSEAGFSATDNVDGDITDKVVFSNNINFNEVGTYFVKYSVSDSSGNEFSIERKVNVLNVESSSSGIPVLMYHFFYPDSDTSAHDNNFISVSKFDEQIKYLKDNNYYFASWSDVNDYLDGKINLPKNTIVITVDDGSSTFFQYAYPILKKYNVFATSFIVTSWLKPSDEYDRSFISYQSHSHNMHRGGCSTGHGGIFQCIDYNAGYDDLVTSKNISGGTVFCYPFGDVNDREVELVKKAQYEMAFTTAYGKIKPGMDKYRLPRVRISGGITIQSFINSIK